MIIHFGKGYGESYGEEPHPNSPAFGHPSSPLPMGEGKRGRGDGVRLHGLSMLLGGLEKAFLRIMLLVFIDELLDLPLDPREYELEIFGFMLRIEDFGIDL